jgi:hypothetical protein
MLDLSIEKLMFELDNDQEILDFKLKNGFLLWPQIRYSIYRKLINTNDIESVSKKLIKRKPLEIVKIISSQFIDYLSFLIISNHKYDVIAFSASISTFQDNQNRYRSKINNFISGISELNSLNVFSNSINSSNEKFVIPFILREVIQFKYRVLKKVTRKYQNEDIVIGTAFINFLKLNTKHIKLLFK